MNEAPRLTLFSTPAGGSCCEPAEPDPRKALVGVPMRRAYV